MHAPSKKTPRWSSGKNPTKKRGATTISPVGKTDADGQDDLSLWLHSPLSRCEEKAAVRASTDATVHIRSCVIEIAREHPAASPIIPITTGQGQT
jgi:hypothetical protein